MSRGNGRRPLRKRLDHRHAVDGRVTETSGYRKNDRVTAVDRLKTMAQSGPVKTWADMTPEEREKVLADLKGRKP